MSVVIISAVTYSHGEEVAKRAARLLDFRWIGRAEVVDEAARAYGAPADRLVRALDEPPGWRAMPAKERKVRLAAIQAVVADSLVDGDCVCYGLAAHLYITGISHVVRVRIVAPAEERIAAAARQEHLGKANARRRVTARDRQRRRWVSSIFGVDESDPGRFDLVIDQGEMEIDDAAESIAHTARQRRFRPMSYSLKEIRDYALAARVRASLVAIDPDVAVRADDGAVHIEARSVGRGGDKAATFKERALAVPRVQEVEVHLIDDVFAKAALSMR